MSDVITFIFQTGILFGFILGVFIIIIFTMFMVGWNQGKKWAFHNYDKHGKAWLDKEIEYLKEKKKARWYR